MISEVLIEGIAGCLHIELFADNSCDLAIHIDGMREAMDRFTVLVPARKCRELGRAFIAYADIVEALDIPEFER